MNIKLVARYVIFFGLAFFLLWYATKDLELENIWQHVKQSDKTMLWLIVLVAIISIVLRTWRWQLLIEPLGKVPGFWNTFFSIFIGYGVNFMTPRLGEVARCGILSKYEDIPADKLAGTMIAERIFDLVCLIIVAMLTLLIEYTQLNSYFAQTVLQPLQAKFGGNTLYILIGVGILGIVGAILLWRFLSNKANDKQSKFVSILNNLKEGVTAVFKMKKRFAFIWQTVLIWVCYLAMSYIGFLSLPQLSHLSVGASLSVLTLGSVGIIATPGGTGSYQLIVSSLLNAVYGIDKEIAGTYAILSWALQNGVLLIGSAVAMILFPIINNKVKKEKPLIK
jgi:glycosyltransferase 2 family protein